MKISDGNGRTGRVIMMEQCLQNGLDFFIIPVSDKWKYIDFLQNEDIEEFSKWIKELQEIEKRKMISFYLKENPVEIIVKEMLKKYIEENELNSLDEDDYDNIYDQICDTLNISDEDNYIKDIVIEVLDEKYQDFNEIDIEI